MSMSSWTPDERVEILRDLAEWQERDEAIGAAGIKILSESSPTAGTTIYRADLRVTYIPSPNAA